jgi:hypothetical protein
MKVRHGALATQTLTQSGIFVSPKVDTDVMPHQLHGIRIASVKRNFAPAQWATAVVINGQRGHALNFTYSDLS